MAVIDAGQYGVWIDESYDALDGFIQDLEASRIFILIDENTNKYCLNRLNAKLDHSMCVIEIHSGEQYKNLDSCQMIWNQLLDSGCDRKSLLINLGGGVIGDMGGFAASTFMRGLPFINIPTTLLSQVDASVGSKLGVDFKGHKNTIGLFNDPALVFIDTSFLETLEMRQLKSGFAEIIKHALIQSESMWNQIVTLGDMALSSANWKDWVTESVIIKNQIVQQDKGESGLRKILNFGHTIGHAIESSLLEKEDALLHGEAIAIGMICESYISHKLNMISEEDLIDITSLVLSIYTDHRPTAFNRTDILSFAQKDKKNLEGSMMFSLLEGIGSAQFNIEVSEDLILKSLDYYLNNG